MANCKYFDLHNDGPQFWIRWQAWASVMRRDHIQSPCLGCGKWHIWTKVDPVDEDERWTTLTPPEPKKKLKDRSLLRKANRLMRKKRANAIAANGDGKARVTDGKK